ncbi:aminopeptidase P family protein [Thalassobaculum sp. OXR-137]|uniref:aminopeptidase P family protein n=1 Tax=Thalassobaculum sp. OXR-137 TaxID=3100173 RepID=UPI002AC97B56|nr:aminopeptidase P family protein [Thalassobaculum sp. OXR-137]WPZ36220.1 aminopeptidase P family protein [Thalassobaculum sp. OXR-137]
MPSIAPTPSPDIAALATDLRAAGAQTDAAGLAEILGRIAAGPRTYPARAWHRLIAADLSDALAERLDAAVEALRPGEPKADPTRLDRLRAALAEAGVDGFILPRADEHMGEYIPAPAERLSWLTGFTGSAGVVLVLPEVAVIFVDGRYTLQVAQQVDTGRWSVEHVIRTPPADYVRKHLAGRRLGFDPKLHSINAAKRLADAAGESGGSLVPLETNPIDALWADRPAAPLGPVEVLPTTLTGLDAAAKRERIAADLATRGIDATVLNQPESIAWLLNLRGADVPYTPLPLAYATMDRTGMVELFLDEAKCTADVRTALGNGVTLRPFEAVGAALDALGAAGSTVAIDPDAATEWMRGRLDAAGATVVLGEDPCILPRARKNAVELAGTRAAHTRDAAAMARFLKWIDDTGTGTTELGASDALEGFRSQVANWRGPSFPSISGAGSDGAIVHYRVTPETDRPLEDGSLYLIDSGAQYLDGTTDITRTVAVGRPTPEMRERFTLVLKGHIAIATARFPTGTTGGQLDALARQFLWRAGLDFDHGTGHGVGVFLGVHEGPQRISSASRVPIEASMILSNEPGYYKPGAYGIRIENLLIAVEAPAQEDNGRAMLCFETITFAPIDRRLVDPALMTEEEIAWLDRYHAEVRRRVSPALDAAHREWLEDATAPLGGG